MVSAKGRRPLARKLLGRGIAMGMGQAAKMTSVQNVWVLGAGKFGLRAALIMQKNAIVP